MARLILCVAFTAGLAAQRVSPDVPNVPDVAELHALVQQYATGSHAEAVATLASFDEAHVRRLDAGPDADPRTLAIAALLHTEAAIRNGTYYRVASDRVFSFRGRPEDYGVHFAKAYPYVERLVALKAKHTWIEPFVTEWIVATASYGARLRLVGVMSRDAIDQARRWFPDNARVLLLGGFRAERAMGPEKSGPGHGAAIHFTPHETEEAFAAIVEGRPVPGLVSTSHGRFSRLGLQVAESYFRRALIAAPSLVDARVRLGRLLYLSDRTKEATAELEQALRDASAAGRAVPAYWAALQLGLAREQLQQADAVDAYQVALRIHPGGRSAYLAMGALAARNGSAAAWPYATQALGTVGVDGRGDLDPWVLYPYLDYWRLADALATMREWVTAPEGVPR